MPFFGWAGDYSLMINIRVAMTGLSIHAAFPVLQMLHWLIMETISSFTCLQSSSRYSWKHKSAERGYCSNSRRMLEISRAGSRVHFTILGFIHTYKRLLGWNALHKEWAVLVLLTTEWVGGKPFFTTLHLRMSRLFSFFFLNLETAEDEMNLKHLVVMVGCAPKISRTSVQFMTGVIKS